MKPDDTASREMAVMEQESLAASARERWDEAAHQLRFRESRLQRATATYPGSTEEVPVLAD